MKKKEDKTVPFFKVRKEDRKKAIENMRTYTGADPTKLTVELAQTAFKALVGAVVDGKNSQIVGVPIVVRSVYGPTLRIPLKNQPHPAFASLKQLQSYL